MIPAFQVSLMKECLVNTHIKGTQDSRWNASMVTICDYYETGLSELLGHLSNTGNNHGHKNSLGAAYGQKVALLELGVSRSNYHVPKE